MHPAGGNAREVGAGLRELGQHAGTAAATGDQSDVGHVGVERGGQYFDLIPAVRGDHHRQGAAHRARVDLAVTR